MNKRESDRKIRKSFLIVCMLAAGMMLTSCGSSSKDVKDASDKNDAEGAVMQGGTENSARYTDVMDIGETTQKEGWTQTEVFSTEIQDRFVIDVCLPKDYDENKSYPVVYLTDCYWRRGDYGSITQLYESGQVREFILIGIGYPDDYDFDTIRVRDLIEEPDRFLRLIVNGIMPYIESTYAIDVNDRTFCGASYGGYFMVYSLFQNDGLTEGLFRNYILASPTFFESTHGLPLADYEDAFYRKLEEHELNVNVYMSVGGDEDEGDFIRPIRKFVKRLEKREYQGLNLTYQEYEGMGHYDVWVPTLLDGLCMLLKE